MSEQLRVINNHFETLFQMKQHRNITAVSIIGRSQCREKDREKSFICSLPQNHDTMDSTSELRESPIIVSATTATTTNAPTAAAVPPKQSRLNTPPQRYIQKEIQDMLEANGKIEENAMRINELEKATKIRLRRLQATQTTIEEHIAKIESLERRRKRDWEELDLARHKQRDIEETLREIHDDCHENVKGIEDRMQFKLLQQRKQLAQVEDTFSQAVNALKKEITALKCARDNSTQEVHSLQAQWDMWRHSHAPHNPSVISERVH